MLSLSFTFAGAAICAKQAVNFVREKKVDSMQLVAGITALVGGLHFLTKSEEVGVSPADWKMTLSKVKVGCRHALKNGVFVIGSETKAPGLDIKRHLSKIDVSFDPEIVQFLCDAELTQEGVRHFYNHGFKEKMYAYTAHVSLNTNAFGTIRNKFS